MDNNLKESKSLYISGLASVQTPDSSGEVLDIKGADIYSFEHGDGTINWEHRGPDSNGASPMDIVGKIVYVKKIFKLEDCENDDQRTYYNKFKLPCIYIIGRLFDGAGHPGAVALAAILRDAADNNEPCVIKYSVEGSTLSRKNNLLTKTVLRAVAVTQKACNKASLSGILTDPNAPKGFNKNPNEVPEKSWIDELIENTRKDEAKDPMFETLGHSVQLRYTSFSDLEKMLEAGNYNAAPSTLTQGSALQVEDPSVRRKKIEQLAAMAKAAIRDWNKIDDVHKFLKHRLPEASDDFINKFADMANDWKIKKSEEDFQILHKFEYLYTELTTNLRKAVQDLAPNTVDYGQKKVIPGKATANGINLHVLHQSPEGDIVGVPEDKMPNHSGKDLVNVKHGHFTLHSVPKTVKESNVINALTHGDFDLNKRPEQHALIHNTDMDKSPVHPPKGAVEESFLSNQSHWRNMDNGRMAYVKPGNNEMARNEVATSNLGKDFFGLGEYMPNAAAFKHPKTGEEQVAIEYEPGEHIFVGKNGKPKGDHAKTLKKLGDSGELDKLGMMDAILGTLDRHEQNYVMQPNGLKLIDHENSMNPDRKNSLVDELPDFLTKYHKLTDPPDHGDNSHVLHPEAVKWLMKLNPADLQRHVRSNGYPLKRAKEITNRLIQMQKRVNREPMVSTEALHDVGRGK